MAELKPTLVRHDHKVFLVKAAARKSINKAYDNLSVEYQLFDQLFKARTRAGLTQVAVVAYSKSLNPPC